MRSITRRVVLVLAAGLITAGIVLAEVKSEKITFYKDVKVNGTLLAKGEYKVSFDDQANELIIKKQGETVAKTAARAEKREEKPKRTQVYMAKEGDSSVVTGIAFAGEDYTVVVSDGGKSGR